MVRVREVGTGTFVCYHAAALLERGETPIRPGRPTVGCGEFAQSDTSLGCLWAFARGASSGAREAVALSGPDRARPGTHAVLDAAAAVCSEIADLRRFTTIAA